MKRLFRIFCLGLAALTLGFCVANRTLESIYYHSIIPAKLKPAKPLYIGGESMRYSCGLAAFYTSDRVVDAIAKEGIDFFADAREGKKTNQLFDMIFQPSRSREVNYEPWQTTPMPEKTFSDGWFMSLECAHGLSSRWKHRIDDAARAPGSYYTYSKNEGILLMLPKLKIVIFMYEGD